MENISITPARPSDLALLFALQKEQIDRYENIKALASYEAVLRQLRVHTADGLDQYARIEADGALAGFYRLRRDGEGLELEDFYLLPGWRGRGIGSRVLRDILSSCRTVSLYAFADNQGAVRFYKRLGFRELYRRRTRLRMTREGEK